LRGELKGCVVYLFFVHIFLYEIQTVQKTTSLQSHLKGKSKRTKKKQHKHRNTTMGFLKGRQVRGYDFHRQKPIDEYIVDFFCSELMLEIEIDGISHADKEKYDKERQTKLEKLGVRFLRFDDDYVFYNCDGVIKTIEKWIDENAK